MSKTKIYIYTSDIAALIGQNKWDFVTPFERLWKRCDTSGYQNCMNYFQHKINDFKASLTNIEHEHQQLQSDLENKRITKRQYTLAAKGLDAQKEQILKDVNMLNDRVDDIDLTQQQKLEKSIGKDIVDNIQDASIQTCSKRSQATRAIDNLQDVSELKRKELAKYAESYINKSHGTIKENDAIQMFEHKFNTKLDVSQTFFKKRLDSISDQSAFDWYVCGKMDGIYVDPIDPTNNYVVEVKNRTKGFFSSLRDYEKTQVQMYLWMIGFGKSKLVEKYESRLRITSIYKDESYISDVLEYLSIFITHFEEDFLDNHEIKLQYITKSIDQKKCFLKNLYLQNISKRTNSKIEQQILDQELSNTNCLDNCLIDDLDSV